MAASSGDDIPAQLAALLGYAVQRIRITDEDPPRISVIDLAAAITKKDANHAAQDVGYVKDRHPEVTQILGDFKFRGPGQKKTPETDLRGAVELTFLLPGRHAARPVPEPRPDPVPPCPIPRPVGVGGVGARFARTIQTKLPQ